MTNGPLLGKMIKFSIPIMLAGILQLLFNSTDLVMAGRFEGSEALAGIGGCFTLINLFVNTFMGLSVGAGVTVAQNIGAQKYERLKSIVNTVFTISVVLGTLVAVFGYIAAEPLLVMMNTPKDVLAEAVPYIRAYFVGFPACVIYNYMSAILRSSGDSRRPLYFLATAEAVNIALNYILLRFFNLGVRGVGIATAFSLFVAATLTVVHMIRMNNPCRLTGFAFNKYHFKRIITIGLSAGIQNAFFSLSSVLIQSAVNGYDTVMIAGNSAAANIDGFVYTALNSIYHTALAFTGQNVGASKYDRVKKITVQTLSIVTVMGIILGAVLVFGGPLLLSIYEPNRTDIIDAGMERLLIMGSLYFMCGIMEVASGALRGMGQNLIPTMISLIGTCGIRIVWIYTVCPLFPTNIRALYMCYPITWVITSAFQIFFLIRTYRKSTRMLRSEITPQASV